MAERTYNPFDILTTSDHRFVNKAAFKARRKWKPLGAELGLDKSDLGSIRGEDDDCLDQVLTIWLQRRSLEPTFAKLVKALRDEMVDQEGVAYNVITNYLGGVDPLKAPAPPGTSGTLGGVDPLKAPAPAQPAPPLVPGILGQTPELWDLEYLADPSDTFTVNIIDRLQGDWEKLVGHLRIPGHNIRAIRGMQPFTPAIACREVFRLWLDGGEDEFLTPKNWDTVIKVTKRLNNAKLGGEIRTVLAEKQ